MSDDNGKTDRLLDSFGTRAEDKEGLIDALELLGGLSDAEARAAVDEYLTGSWRRKGQSRAEGLVTGATDERLPEDERSHPWTPGLHMEVRARGRWSRAIGRSTAASATAGMPTRCTATAS